MLFVVDFCCISVWTACYQIFFSLMSEATTYVVIASSIVHCIMLFVTILRMLDHIVLL